VKEREPEMSVADYKELRVYSLAFKSAMERHARLRDHYGHICRQLTNIMNDAGSWCGLGCELREVPAEYFIEPRSDALHAPRS
jgi:hypothetical protein